MKNFCSTVDPIKKEKKKPESKRIYLQLLYPIKDLSRIDKELLSIKREVETPSRNEQKA